MERNEAVEQPIKDNVRACVYQALDEVNELLLSDDRLPKTPATVLYSNSGGLDSLGLVNLIVAVEQKIFKKMNITLSLVNEESMSQKDSPFYSVETLCAYIAMLISKKSPGTNS